MEQATVPTHTRLITPDEYVKMIEAGILREDERLELLYGRIVPMAPQNDPHALALGELVHQLNRLIGADQHVWVQAPIQLPPTAIDPAGSRPEPDAAIVRWPLERVPRPEDIQLVVEVSDTTLTRDQRQKLPLYAAAGISECWIVDLPHRVTWHRAPQPDGVYTDVRSYRQTGALPVLSGQVDIARVLRHA